MFNWYVILPLWLAVMLIIGRELPEHFRSKHTGNIIAALVVMAVVTAFAFMTVFWRVFLR